MTTQRPRHGGFTLIELLVVISILALLAALAVGGYMRVRKGQEETQSRNLVSNRNTALTRIWAATRDQADKEFKDDANGCKTTLTSYCGGDSDRARSIWLYAKTKADFPQTLWQAGRPVVLRDSTNTVVLSIPPRKVFTANPVIQSIAKMNLSTDPLFDAAETDKPTKAFNQSAALIYLVLTERGSRGEVDDAGSAPTASLAAKDDLCHLMPPANGPVPPLLHPQSNEPMKAFADVQGVPIGFVRWATNGDLTDPNNGFAKKGARNGDPFDPDGRLNAAWPNRAAAAFSLFGIVNATTPPPNVWTRNWQPILISTGADRAINFNLADVDPQTGLTYVNENEGDILGYRLKREGN